MFGSKRVTWKKSEKTIARYLRVGSIHKTLRKKIDLDPRKDKVLVWSGSAHPSPILPERFDTVDLGNKEFLSEYTSILFWSNVSVRVEMPIRHRTNPQSPYLSGTIGMFIQINPENKMDYGVGKKLVDAFFKSGTERDILDSGAIHSLVKEAIKGNEGDFLEGISEDNLMNESFQRALSQNAEEHLAQSLAAMGLGVSDLTLSWKPTSRMRTAAKTSQTDAIQDRIMADTKREAIESLASDGKKALVDAQKKAIADAIKIELKGDLAVKKAQAARAVALEERGTESELAEIGREIEIEDAKKENEISLMAAKRDAEISIIMHDAEMTKKQKELQIKAIEDHHETEIESIKMGNRLTELKGTSEVLSDAFETVTSAIKEGMSEDLASTILDGLLIKDSKGQVYDAGDLIHEDTVAELEMGFLTAEQIDGLSDSMRNKANDGTLSRKQRSNLWAGVAVYERFRGNKENRMERALEYSFGLDEENPIALKCRMEYLWNRHPQQFIEGKMELPHLKKQVVEIEGLLDSLVNHEKPFRGRKGEMEQKHKHALITLSRDSEDGEAYMRKLEEAYEMVIGE